MKKINCLFCCAIFLLVCSCGKECELEHKGKKTMVGFFSEIDSIPLNADSISWNGNFFSHGDNLCFADRYYTTVLFFDWKDGMVKQKMLKRGHSKNELSNFVYAYHLGGTTDRIVFIDASNSMYIYNTTTSSFEYRGTINMGWQSPKKGDYDDPSVYNLMELDDCGVDFYKLKDHEILMPLSFVNRNLDDIDMSRYKKGHIFGKYDYKKEEITSLFGAYPKCYIDSPAPNYENFRYVRIGSDFYVCHTADSLIYVYDEQENVKFCFGYEFFGADRTYSGKNFEQGADYLKDDMKRVTVNAGLVYSKKLNALLRVSWNKVLSENERTTSVQLYDCTNFNLIAEEKYSGLFQFLYTKDQSFYGVNLLSTEEENDKYYIYKISVKL